MKVQCISEREMLVRTCVHTAGLSQHSSPGYRYLPPITSNIVSTPLYLLALTSSLPIRRAGAGAEAESSSSTSFNVLTATSRRLKVCRYLLLTVRDLAVSVGPDNSEFNSHQRSYSHSHPACPAPSLTLSGVDHPASYHRSTVSMRLCLTLCM